MTDAVIDAVIDATVDLAGEICPFTFVRTKLALEQLAIGGVLRVVVDHEPAIRNIPRSAREWGQEVLGVAELAAAAATTAAPGDAAPAASTGRRWAIDLRRRVR